MRKIKLFLIVTLLSSLASAQSTLRWNYPCKPGTECWNALTSVEERQEACQIKGIDLKTLSTEELLLITMEHPFFQSYVAHDSPIEGLGFALEGFNGFTEFKRRPDAMKALRDVYFREDFSKIVTLADSAEMGAYSLNWIGAELIMRDDALLNQMSSDEKAEFLKRLYSQLLIKQRYRDVFGGISDAVSAYIYYKVMKTMNVNVLEDAFNEQSADLFRNRLIAKDADELKTLLVKFEEFVKSVKH
ncbi:hypothetical protein SAMN04487996_13020 [Dyadobacter soli]|uniref:Uncharacterized protein n=1 Tax=Dyadobacter soli TaxID=659014 RepID=A0A1G8A8S8_9BACT|nr:hypothetical protein [Dyadobacter soli]SDH17328.1 hypothetical protein SAMN04487996_13020 [Dyadobacter soli]